MQLIRAEDLLILNKFSQFLRTEKLFTIFGVFVLSFVEKKSRVVQETAENPKKITAILNL